MSDDCSPYHPIIYVRGYAMTQAEIDATVATPYMGFNMGSTKVRQDWRGNTVRHIFESPLIRLMKDYNYRDVYSNGSEIEGRIAARSVVIYRHYEQLTTKDGPPSITDAAAGLKTLIHNVRKSVCGDDVEALMAFRVYLVAHSMGGLICRCFLQNDGISSDADRAMVDKVFTYATPHNGIELAAVNVPKFLNLWDINNFNRDHMAAYLNLPDSKRVDSLNGKFNPERFFCLVGSNHRDYDVAMGLSSRLAGEMSDGLVHIENASVRGAPRAFVHRSHSGPYGIVNSEQGYQHLSRFLFGDVRLQGILEVMELPLPPSVRKEYQRDKTVRASYYFESTVSPRGGSNYKLNERRRETQSAILRKFDQMFKPAVEGLSQPRWPILFTSFFDSRRTAAGKTIVFTADIAVSTTGYSVDRELWFDREIPGEYLFRDTVSIRATPGPEGWRLRYTLTDQSWAEGAGKLLKQDEKGAYIPLSTKKGFDAKLRIHVENWR